MSLVTWGIQEYTIYYFDKLKKEVGTVINHFALKDQENIFLLKRKCKYNQQYTSSMLNLNKHNGNQFYDLSRVFLHRPFTLSARCPEVENIYLSYIIIYYTMKRAFPEHKKRSLFIIPTYFVDLPDAKQRADSILKNYEF